MGDIADRTAAEAGIGVGSAPGAASVRRRLAASPNVQLVLNLAGAFDILILVVAPDMDAYNDLAARLLEQPGIRRFESTFVKSRVKATLAVPLSDQAGARP